MKDLGSKAVTVPQAAGSREGRILPQLCSLLPVNGTQDQSLQLSHLSFHPQQSTMGDASTRAAAKTRPSLPVLEGKAPDQMDVRRGWEARSFFLISYMYCLLAKSATVELPPSANGVSRSFLLALACCRQRCLPGRGCCQLEGQGGSCKAGQRCSTLP